MAKSEDRVIPNYSKLNTLLPQDLFKHELAKIAFRFSRDNLLPTFQHLASKTSEISTCNTKPSKKNIYNLHKPRYTNIRLQKVLSTEE